MGFWRKVLVEICNQRGCSLLTGNHCPSPGAKPDVIYKYFCYLEKSFDTKIRVFVWLGISVLLTFTSWAVCPIKLPFLFKIKGDAIYTSTCPLWSYSVRTDWQLSWPSFSNSNPVSTLLPLVLSSPIAATAYWHWFCFVFTQFYVTSWTFLQ
jgi:hypothetical protein